MGPSLDLLTARVVWASTGVDEDAGWAAGGSNGRPQSNGEVVPSVYRREPRVESNSCSVGGPLLEYLKEVCTAAQRRQPIPSFLATSTSAQGA